MARAKRSLSTTGRMTDHANLDAAMQPQPLERAALNA
jgi:hypothetical protein